MGRHLGQEVGFEPQEWQPNLYLSSWNGEDCLREYVRHSVKIRFIFEMFYKAKATNALIKAAPALKEISFLGYLTSHFRGVEPKLNFDHIVVDAPATGHFISCLQVPEALLAITSKGPMGQHCRGIIEVLKDPKRTQVYTVCLPEPLVLREQSELKHKLQDQFQITPQVLLNRSLLQMGVSQIDMMVDTLSSSSKNFIETLRNNLELEKSLEQESLYGRAFPESLKIDFLSVARTLSSENLWKEEGHD